MHRNATALRTALVLALCGASGGASAEPVLLASRDAFAGLESKSQDDKPARAKKRIDLSRFTDGPRWVPAPRGRAQARALELGIGTHEQIVKLLRSGPSAELRAAVPGERPRTLLWPVPGGHPGRGFGFTRKQRTDLRHNGIDIGAEAGTAIRAAEAGLVVYSDNTLKGYGNCVIVLHPGGLMTLYAHNQRNTVQAGYFVERGERIALLGATGYAWGPHLHFELRDGFRPRDPAPMIRGFHSDELAGPVAELQAPRPTGAATIQPKPSPTPAPAVPAPAVPAPSSAPTTELRTFRTLLFPLKGGRIVRDFEASHAAIALAADVGAGVRAAVDGVITYAGPALPKHGDAKTAQTIVLEHADGSISTYTAPLTDALESGARVLRGQWLGRLATTDALRFTWQRDGKAIDPAPVLVGP